MKWSQFISGLALSIAVGACSNLGPAREPTHPALLVLEEYAEAVRAEQSIESILKQYHSEADATRGISALGWARYPYIVAMLALQNGECVELNVSEMNAYKVQVDCQGPYVYHSAILGTSHEYMHLRIFMHRKAGRWLVGKGGLAYTQAYGDPITNPEISQIGLKFSHNIKASDALKKQTK